MDKIDYDYEILSKELQSAYRKYKNHIYYDSYAAIQRFNLAEFELKYFGKDFKSDEFNKNQFDSNVNKYFENFAKKLINNFDIVIEEICKKIDVISIPKRFLDENDDENIISNFNKPNYKLTNIHYFIDLPIQGHILGVLWILKCGYVLDDKLYSNCYGNRLNETLLEKLKNQPETEEQTPFLFKPYYKNYESWRDGGLNSLKSILDEKKNAIMLSLDFKDYYYRSLIDFRDLEKDIVNTNNKLSNDKNNELLGLEKYLTDFIKNVFNEYSSKFHREIKNDALYMHNIKHTDSYKKLPMIPLGFLPSLIISNWNLQGFDQAILEDVNPVYYGRYVDDVLIVLNSHEKSDSFGYQHIKELNLSDILNKYFTKSFENPINHILHCNDEECKPIRVYNLQIDKSDKDISYYHYENLEIQKEKLRIYKFLHNQSDSIIKNFRKEIFKNSSEFRLMHGLTDIVDDLEKNTYKINYKESINKLNDIKDVRINKYEISKILSRLNISSKNMYRDLISDATVNEVKNAFCGKNLEFISLWEKLFIFLYINGKYDDLVEMIENIIEDINSIKICLGLEKLKDYDDYNWDWDTSYIFTLNSDNLNQNYDFDSKKELDNLFKSLSNFLYASFIRTISLKSTDYIKFKNLFIANEFSLYKGNILNDVIKFIFSSMQNNSLMKYPLRDTISICKKIDRGYDLIKEKNKYVDLYYGIYPRFIKFNELIFHEINQEIFKDNCDNNDNKFELYIKKAMDNYNELNFDIESNYLYENIYVDENNEHINSKVSKFIQVNSSKCNANSSENNIIKVGLLNTKLFEKNIKDRLKGSPNLSLDRFDDIKKLINESIEKKVKLLIMPEMYIPYEWINEIVRVSKDHQMAIIFGVEPVINDDKVGNYIMASLPFIVNEKYYETLLNYRLKNHYSPHELKLYKKYDKQPIEDKNNNGEINKKYYLFNWNNFHISSYYCYEIADIQDRGIFKSHCDIITVSEFNKDVNYFNNIAESLCRDLFCYCIKSNTSEFGGNVILQPSSSENKYLINLKGGEDDYIVTHNLNIKKLREDAIKNDEYSDDSYFKPKPPGFNKNSVKKRMGLN